MEVSDVDCDGTISRALFNNLTKDLVARLKVPMYKALNDAKLTKEDIDEIILIGGSSRIVKVQEFVTNFFNGKEPNRNINPDEAVAYGASE